MAVAFDAATEHIKDADPDVYSHGGAASGVKGVVVIINNLDSNTDHVTAVSYGGAALTEIVQATDAASETGNVQIWFLGTSVPQGTQNVSYGNSGTADAMWSTCVTLTGSDDLEVVDFDELNDNQTNPSVTLQYGGRTCIALAGLHTGHNSIASFTENANCTRIHDASTGSRSCASMRQTTPGTADFAIGGTAAAEDCAFAAIAVSEVVAAGGLSIPIAMYHYRRQ